MAPSDRGQYKMLNFQSVVGLLVTAGIVWVGLSRIDLSQRVAAFAFVRVGFVLAGSALIIAVIAIFAVRWRVLLPNRPDVPVRFVFCYLMIGYIGERDHSGAARRFGARLSAGSKAWNRGVYDTVHGSRGMIIRRPRDRRHRLARVDRPRSSAPSQGRPAHVRIRWHHRHVADVWTVFLEAVDWVARLAQC